MTVYATYIAPSPEFDIQVVISRAVVLALATTMLAYLGAAHAHGQERLKSLASWPRRVLPDRSALARDIVESAAHILGAPRLLLIWDTEEPWVDVALWSDSRFTIRHEPPGTFGRVVADALRPYGFICLDATRPMARVVYASDRGLQWWRGAPIDPTLRERFDIQIVASWPVRADGVEGRLFSLDKADIKVEDLVYGEILAGLVSSRLGQADLMEQLRQRAFSEDRLKIARDLHDGVLQSLTAAALQIQAARRLLKDDPAAVEERLSELQRIIAAEHVDIRGFIEQLKPGRPDLPVGSVSLGSHLTGLASRIKRQWGIDVHVAFEPDPLTIPELIATDVYLLVHEALVNAARHARASKVLVAVFQSGDRLSIVVSDDGQGFPFKGRLTLDELRQRQVGPVSLRDRVTSLGGQLTVESTADGAKVQVDLPLAGAGR
jgi:signal transduction histidine kinase